MLNAGLATLAYLKSRLLPEAAVAETQWDAALSRLGLGVAGLLQRHCNRRLDRTVGAVDEFSGRSLAITLRCYPLESIATVQLRDASGILTPVSNSYSKSAACGLLEFLSPPGGQSTRLVVTYTGGYWLDDGTSLPGGATPLPDDLLEAWVAQCQATAASRSIFGSISLTDPKTAKPSGDLLPEVLETLRGYRRFSGE